MAISYGSENTLTTLSVSNTNSVLLDATHAFIIYNDSEDGYYGKAVVATISGDTISFGTIYTFISASVNSLAVVLIDSTHVLVVSAYGGNGKALVATISGSTISFGTEYTFNTGGTGVSYVALLDSTHAIITYRDEGNSYYGTGIIATLSGSVISFGSEYVFNSAITDLPRVKTIDSTHAIIVFIDSTGHGKAIVATISGDTISVGTKYTFNAASTTELFFVMIDSTHAFIIFRDAGNSNYGTGIIATITGSTISYGSEYVFNSALTQVMVTAMLDATRAIVCFLDAGNSNYGTGIIATITGSTISYSPEYVFESGTTYNIFPVKIDSTHAMIIYRDVVDGNNGKAIVATKYIASSAVQDGTHIDLSWT